VQTVGDDANKTKRLWEMLSPALEWADDITLIEAMAHTMGRLVKSGGAMASDIVDLEVGSSGVCVCACAQAPCMRVCACLSAYACMCVHVCMHVCVCVFAHVYRCLQTYASTSVYA